MNLCATCSSPLVAQADALVVAGASIASTARRLRLSKQSLARHVRHGHVRPAPPEAPRTTQEGIGPPGSTNASPGGPEAPRSPVDDDAPVDLAAELRSQLRQLGAIDVSNLSVAARHDIFEARRRAVDSLARVEPPRPSASVGVMEVDGMREFLAILTEELEPHMDLRMRVLARMRAEGIADLMDGGAGA